MGHRQILTGNLATSVPTGIVDLLILRSISRLHVPIKPILQTKRVVFIFYTLELFLSAAQSMCSMNKM